MVIEISEVENSKKENIKNSLRSKRDCLLKLLIKGSYAELLNMLDTLTSEYMLNMNEYDRFSNVMPYTNNVSEHYKIEYVNASFVSINNKYYIACQEPKYVFIERFLNFVNKVEPEYIICLKDNPIYLNNENIKVTKTIEHNGKIVIREVQFNIESKEFKVIECPVWNDHSVLEKEEMELIWKYLKKFNNGIKIIHCRAGVGRTGTFIMFDALKSLEYVDFEIFVDTLICLREQRNLMVQSVSQLKFLVNYFLKDKILNDCC